VTFLAIDGGPVLLGPNALAVAPDAALVAPEVVLVGSTRLVNLNYHQTVRFPDPPAGTVWFAEVGGTAMAVGLGEQDIVVGRVNEAQADLIAYLVDIANPLRPSPQQAFRVHRPATRRSRWRSAAVCRSGRRGGCMT